jgi:hypothetical protein
MDWTLLLGVVADPILLGERTDPIWALPRFDDYFHENRQLIFQAFLIYLLV